MVAHVVSQNGLAKKAWILKKQWDGPKILRTFLCPWILSCSCVQPIVRRDVVHVWHFCSDDLVVGQRTRTVLIMTTCLES